MSSNDPNIATASADKAATIAINQTTSGAIDLLGTSLCGLFMPDAFTGASIKILGAPTLLGTYVNVQDGAGSDLSLAVAASKFVPISNLALVAGLRFIKLVSNATEPAARTIQLATKPL